MRTDARQVSSRRCFEFTRREFWRGAWAAWAIFMGILVIALVVVAVAQSSPLWGPPLASIALYLIYGVPIGGIIACLAMLAGSPAAWGLGRLLARTDRILIHVASYAALGAVVGTAVTAIAAMLSGTFEIAVIAQPFTTMVMGACAISVAGGWLWSFRQANREVFRTS